MQSQGRVTEVIVKAVGHSVFNTRHRASHGYFSFAVTESLRVQSRSGLQALHDVIT